MRRVHVIAGLLLVGLTGAAIAETAYYVALDLRTNTCSIVTEKPDGTTKLMVGARSYSIRAQADAARKAAAACKMQ